MLDESKEMGSELKKWPVIEFDLFGLFGLCCSEAFGNSCILPTKEEWN